MPGSIFNLNIGELQAAAAVEQEMLGDVDSELTDTPSLTFLTDIELDPFNSGERSGSMCSNLHRFSAQSLLPLELVEMIAIRASDDRDLKNFMLTCKRFAAAALEKSTVWRIRFLDRYDQPIIADSYEFKIAYQLREMVLGKFPSFKDGGGRRGKIALEVLRDMVLESYHGLHGITYQRSRNLHILSNPGRAPYMYEFLSSPFYAYEKHTYGKPHRLFDALQIVFSHLVLHPRSEFAVPTNFDARIDTSRDNYDLSVVYLYDTPLKTLYHVGPGREEGSGLSVILDLNAVLHIRNFWHGHLASTVTSMYAKPITTYGEMALALMEQGLAPQQWDRPIQQPSDILPRWFGHYSCTHPTPRKFCDIEEHQTCAEDWVNEFGTEGVHPLTLDIVTTAMPQRGWWPPIFATIPILESNAPDEDSNNGYVFMRGIAPFLAPRQNPDMYPAYTALRVRGIIHSLPEQAEIPGWRRIVMVLYKPTSQYLLAVLDEISPNGEVEEHHDALGQTAPTMSSSSPNMNGQQENPAAISLLGNPMQTGTSNLLQGQGQSQSPTQAAQQINEEAEKTLREELESREELKGPLGPTHLTKEFISTMEDNLHPPEELSWEDLSYAYVYEGVITPGGKIMMGRYWRAGPPSAIDGFELGGGADRGPWLFWC